MLSKVHVCMPRVVIMQFVQTLVACVAFIAVASSQRLPTIVGGRDAIVGEFPWQASLQLLGGHFCGAALVTSQWLITAGHCSIGINSTLYKVMLGAHDIETLQEGDPTEYSTTEFIRHPAYDPSFGLPQNDIGVVKLRTPAVLDGTYVDTVRPAPADVGDLVGAHCTITGWGNTKKGSTDPANILQAASTVPMSNDLCASKFEEMPEGAIPIVDTQICVAGTGNEGGCHGDSGGPMTCTLDSGEVILAGVTSGGSPECDTEYPSVYTRISEYRQWLSDVSDGDIAITL